MVTELDLTSLKELTSTGTSVVDFWAPWCGPCKRLAPIFESVANELGDKIKFGKVNVQEHSGAAPEFGVSGIPCVIVFKDGKEVDRIVGVLPEPALKAKLNEFI